MPSSPNSEAPSRRGGRAFSRTIECPSRSREIWTEGSSRPFGGRGILVTSATSGAMARATPPSVWTRSASASTELLHDLRLVVLVEEQMQRIEGRPRHLPVVLLVHVAHRAGVREQLIQRGRAEGAGVVAEGQVVLGQGAKGLDLLGVLVELGLGAGGSLFVHVCGLQ